MSEGVRGWISRWSPEKISEENLGKIIGKIPGGAAPKKKSMEVFLKESLKEFQSDFGWNF